MQKEERDVLQPRPASEGGGGPEAGKGAKAEELEQLRRLLLANEQERLGDLEKAVAKGGVDAKRLSDLLPDAILLRGEGDQGLPRALAPTLEASFEDSVKRNPRTLANVIYPIIGPAIRQSIRNALTSLSEGFNEALEHSFSARGIGWRIEAWRTGRPFSEVVLLHSLVYRVEQVFLVHTQTGLLLEHVYAPSVRARDPELVSSMLAALRDFVEDSFSDGELRQQLSQVSFQELTLVVQPGPAAVVAAVVRGAPPTELRKKLEATVEQIHTERAEELAAFEGDPAPFRATVPLLEECLVEHRRERRRGPSRAIGLFVVGAILAVITVWALGRARDEHRWEAAVEALRGEPGLVVVDVDDAERRVRGMRDRLSRDPSEVLAGVDFDPDEIQFEWTSFASHEPQLVLAHARDILDPPDSVGTRLVSGVLYLSGRATHAWVQRATQLAPALQGILRVDSEALIDADSERASQARDTLEALRLRFTPQSAVLPSGAWEARDLTQVVAHLVQAADFVGGLRRIDVIGSVLPSEDPGQALQRAESVRSRLRSEVPRSVFIVTDVASEPADFPEVTFSAVLAR